MARGRPLLLEEPAPTGIFTPRRLRGEFYRASSSSQSLKNRASTGVSTFASTTCV